VGESIYRVPAPKPVPPDPYLLAWASLRRRRVTMWIMLLAWLPLGAVAMACLGYWGWFIVFPHFAAFWVSAVMMACFRCPHCGELFAKKSVPWNDPINAFVRRCVHCGICTGTPRSAVVAAKRDSTSANVEDSAPSALRVSVDGNGPLTARVHDEDVGIVESVEDPDVVAGHASHVRHPR
jgi:hypothetical protein